MKIQTNNLHGEALAWAVAQIQGPRSEAACYYGDGDIPLYLDEAEFPEWLPHKNPSQGQPIMAAEGIGVAFQAGAWIAFYLVDNEDDPHDWDFQVSMSGSSMLVAAMRCYVAKHSGSTVDVPDHISNEAED